MSVPIQFKRGTRAQLNALAASGGLLVGEPLFITDEKQTVIADSTSTVAVNPHFHTTFAATNAATLSNYIPALGTVLLNSGFTANIASGRMTAQIAGTYFVTISQLAQTSGGVYFHLRKNGSTITYGYTADNAVLVDMRADALVQLAVGDYLDTFFQNTTTNSFSGAHSSFIAYRIA